MSLSVTFVSNYINHHQIPFCEAMRKKLGDNFVFVQTEQMEQERLDMGWTDESAKLDYVLKQDQNPDLCRSRILSCDLLLVGWAPKAQDAVETRLALHKPVFRISERIYKDGQWKFLSPRGLVSKYKEHVRYRNEPYFLLCAGAYVASDFSLIHAFPEKKYCWGYFPPMKNYEKERLPIHHRRAQDPAVLVWAGRFVSFKHVERALSLAVRLVKDQKPFVLHIMGDAGKEDEETASYARKYCIEHGVEKQVIFHGFCSPDDVRRQMEESDIFIMTSDRGEGWGAVLNEAMNSGCVPVADAQAGAVPYLVKNGVNGYIYADGDEDDFVAKVERLIDDTQLCERFAMMSYRTIRISWNAQTAADRFLNFGEKVLDACNQTSQGKSRRKGKRLDMISLNRGLATEGPMSVAPLIKPYLVVPRLVGDKEAYGRFEKRVKSGISTGYIREEDEDEDEGEHQTAK